MVGSSLCRTLRAAICNKSFNILFCNDSNKITTYPAPYSNYNSVSIPFINISSSIPLSPVYLSS